MAWILVMMFYTTNPAMTTIEGIRSKEACQTMGEEIKRNFPKTTTTIKFYCLERR